MERRFVLFLVLSFAILLGYSWLMQRLYPPHAGKPPQAVAARQGRESRSRRPASKKEPPKPPAEKPAAEKPAGESRKKARAGNQAGRPSRKRPSNGSRSARPIDDDPYRMLVTLTNHGAAVARIELSSPRYCDIDDRSGYLGHLVMDSAAACQRLSGAGGRARHARRRGRPEAGRRDQGRRRQAGRRPTIARSSLGQHEAQADRDACRSSATARN